MPRTNLYPRIAFILVAVLYCSSLAAQPCSGTPNAGLISPLYPNTCANTPFRLVSNLSSFPTGMRYAWQASVDSISWTNLDNGSMLVSPFTTSQTVTRYYRLVDTCLNSGLSAISNVLKIPIGGDYNCVYCFPVYTTGCSGNTSFINRVNMGSFNSPATGCSPGGFDNSKSLYIGDLVRGNLNGIGITSGTPGAPGSSADNVKIWIDFNDNAVYDASEAVATTSGVTSGSLPFSFSIPANATIGRHTMRIRLVNGVAASAIDPCASYTAGETHDYQAGIVGCSGTPAAGVIAASAQPGQTYCTAAGTVYTLLQQSGSAGNPDLRYAWQSSPDSISWTNLSNGPGPVTELAALVSAPTWFRRADTCMLSGLSAVSNTIKLLPRPDCPVNNFCSTAADLPVSAGFCTSPLLGSLALADTTAGLAQPACAAAYKKDLWYKVTVPASGNVTVQTSAVNTFVNNLVLQAYSGSCGGLTLLGCDDDGNPDSGPSANHARLTISGRTPGEIIYFRVLAGSIGNDPAMNGPFAICAFDASPGQLPGIAAGIANSCTAATPVNIDSAFKYAWVSFTDAAGNLIAQVYPNGSKLGLTGTSFYINNGAVRVANNGSIYYLDRNITITPAAQPVSTVTTRLYFTGQELTALSTAAGGLTRSQLNGTKTTQPCPSSAIAANGFFFAQSGNGAYGSGHYIDVSNTSFSTFYLHGGTSPIPVKIEYFRGTGNGAVHQLSWKVSCTHTQYAILTLEVSSDGGQYSTLISSKETALRCQQPFDYTSSQPFAGISYYRLKMEDDNGIVSYSTVVALGNTGQPAAITGISPNPVRGSSFMLSLVCNRAGRSEIIITDIAGRPVSRQQQHLAAGLNNITVNVAALAKGSYEVYAAAAGGKTRLQRFVKE